MFETGLIANRAFAENVKASKDRRRWVFQAILIACLGMP
jgi:hypothetical protein